MPVALLTACGGAAGDGHTAPSDEWPPLSRRVTVEVRNAAMVSGAARDATVRLRHGGLDVVLYDTAPEALQDRDRVTHRILVRRGDTLGVGRIIAVLGPAEVIDAPDATRLADLTVLLGRGTTDPVSPTPS